ncbi:cation:proton antiporter [Aquibaculum sediminis]|uniref:cation:proton antiporter n=1 Tax=Aquibaculum sediminis TaxID=3231907 RepID=UPI00345447FC
MEHEIASVFIEVAGLLALAAVVGFAALLLRQPLIVAFIAAGIIAGPDVLGLAQSADHIELLAEIGVALLLFLVGLKLDVGLVRTLGAVAVATGLGQVAFTAGIGFLICLALGMDWVTSTYVAVALTFSSTIIVVKLLSDKREIDSLHGRIALGFLIVQDIAVVLAMVILSAVGVGAAAGDGGGLALLRVLLGGVAMVAGVVLFIYYGADPLLRRLARSPELLVTFAIAWAVVLAAVGDLLGFGKELGGLLAGVSLASSPFREAIAARLSSLRDFLLLFFFVGLGARLDLGMLGNELPAALILSLFVLIGNPLIVLAIMGYMGYRRRTGLLAGLTVAQISEFSLIFMAMGLALGHVGPSAMGLVTLVGLVTITLSTYMIVHSQRLYSLVEPMIKPFERRHPFREDAAEAVQGPTNFDTILFGLGRYGRGIARGLHDRGQTVLGVDFDPEALRRWTARGLPGTYGDAGDPEFPASLRLEGVSWIVLATPPHRVPPGQSDPRLAMMQAFREAGFRGRFALPSTDLLDARTLYKAGADLVLNPFHDASIRAVERIAGELGEEDEPWEQEARS